MDGAWLARLRWRWRGAWLWPSFALVAVLDGVIVHARPMAGDTQTVAGGIVAALVLNVIAVLLLSRPLGALIRRGRRDMPVGVARNYAGTLAVCLVLAGMVALGVAHHATLVDQQRALRDAVVRAEAFIGDRAPPAFRPMAAHPDTYTIQAGKVYRTCVPDLTGTRSYCVIVTNDRPLAQSVAFAGYESNATFSNGSN